MVGVDLEVEAGVVDTLAPFLFVIVVDDISGHNHPILRMRGGKIAEVSNFKYLSSWIKSCQ